MQRKSPFRLRKPGSLIAQVEHHAYFQLLVTDWFT